MEPQDFEKKGATLAICWNFPFFSQKKTSEKIVISKLSSFCWNPRHGSLSFILMQGSWLRNSWDLPSGPSDAAGKSIGRRQGVVWSFWGKNLVLLPACHSEARRSQAGWANWWWFFGFATFCWTGMHLFSDANLDFCLFSWLHQVSFPTLSPIKLLSRRLFLGIRTCHTGRRGYFG